MSSYSIKMESDSEDLDVDLIERFNDYLPDKCE
jgi:hypothetical protein